MADVAAVRERVQAYLTSEGSVTIDDRGRYSIAYGSTRAFAFVREHPSGESTVVSLFAPVLREVPLTPDLYRYVATGGDDWVFGHLYVEESEGATEGSLLILHKLLGDYLDKDELMYAIIGIASTADELDDKLQPRFGGKRLTDD